MNGTEVQRKFEYEGMRAWLSYDFEWAKEFLCEFRSRVSSLDMLGAKVDFVTYFERRSQIPVLVCLDLVARLHLGDLSHRNWCSSPRLTTKLWAQAEAISCSG